ncbi:MAG: ribonuclease HI [Flavobacteriales bacterium]|nr:ribonuclease HI [Flavobacteriales bacterium]MBK7554809.1 ribonuclease HI [Flavobacteriales bacterium]MBK9196232.1 ribonuclease HI [Flavobacteriales bacterium]
MKVTAYTDGAASGNPGPGGYGVVLEAGKHRKELWGGFRRTTNNRMELLATIVAMESLKSPGTEITIVSDSRYVVDSVEKQWVFDWEKKDFAKKKNPDLWKRFLAIYRQHKVRFQWIRGHNGHPQNELCDQLAVAAREQPDLPADEAYERMGDEGLF